jgi:Mor family transcriptional regulator
MSMAQQRAELLTDVMAHVAATLRELGIDADRADQCGHSIADRLAEHWGGQVICYPVDHAYRLSLRERQILDEYKAGAGKNELAMKYVMTLRGINYLLKRAPRRHLEDNQPDLFPAEPPK